MFSAYAAGIPVAANAFPGIGSKAVAPTGRPRRAQEETMAKTTVTMFPYLGPIVLRSRS